MAFAVRILTHLPLVDHVELENQKNNLFITGVGCVDPQAKHK